MSASRLLAHSKTTALIVDIQSCATWSLPALLARAGIETDLITTADLMQNSQYLKNCWVVPKEALIKKAVAQVQKKSYDWVILTDDEMIGMVLQADIPTEIKLRLLPVISEENFSHLYSKIGLSILLKKQNIQTPPFFIATTLSEAQSAAETLGYPVMIKSDACCGGSDIFEYTAYHQIRPDIFTKPMLVQKKILGATLDLSAIFLHGQLIHFSYALFERVCENQYGPSCLRTYFPLSLVNQAIFQELEILGKALGAHGFVNISCIDASDGTGRYFFEADMRPNVWSEFPRFFGEDPAHRIQAWFAHGTTLTYPVYNPPQSAHSVRIPYFLRLKLWEILTNRYATWKFIPRDDPRLLWLLLKQKFNLALQQRLQAFKQHQSTCLVWLKDHVLFRGLRLLVPKPYRKPIRQFVYKSIYFLAK